jgi:ligand-binding sensor domain-containing protein/signal transduction histidine kinase
MSDGLAGDQVARIVTDSRGFLWFCTGEGLSRFDGSSFTSYGRSDGLPHRAVRDFLETKDGSLWVATADGVARFDALGRRPADAVPSGEPARPLFTSYRPRGAVGWDVSALVEDPDGSIWVGSQLGLFRLERARGSWSLRAIELGMPREPRNMAYANALAIARDGSLFVGAVSGLYHVSRAGRVERYTRRDGLPVDDVRALARAADGRLWVGTALGGVCRLVEEPRAGASVVESVYGPAEGVAKWVGALLPTSGGGVWAPGFEGGLVELRPAGDPRAFSSLRYSPESLGRGGVESLAEDQDGNLWIAAGEAGVRRLARDGFVTYTEADGLKSTQIAGLFADSSGAVCVASRERTNGEVFLNRFDGTRFAAVRPNVPKGIDYFGWGSEQIALQDGAGEWWVPTGEGLVRFPRGSVEALARSAPRAVYKRGAGLPLDEVFRIFEDGRGDVWISTISPDRNGLTRYERATGRLTTYGESAPLRSAELATAFAEDRAGRVYVATNDGRLFRHEGGRFDDLVDPSLAKVWIRSLFIDHGGRLWIATSGAGVRRVDHPEAARPSFVRLTTGGGLSSDSTSCVTEDRWGRVYIGTARGVDRLDAPGRIRRYTAADGLARGLIHAVLRDARGDVWFGTLNGLSRLTPRAPTRARPVRPLIGEVRVGGARLPISELGQADVVLPRLSPGPLDVAISYFALDLASASALRYQVRLEGTERDWSEPAADKSADYARLAPGTYRFLVRVVSSEGTVGRVPASVRFTILPPFWRRGPVLAAAALLAALAAYSFHRSRLRRFLEIERIRGRITTDLHDDIGSSLSQIAILSEVARRDAGGNGGRTKETLTDIAGLSRDLVDSMADIVWAIDPKKDRLRDLTLRMRRFAGDLLSSRDVEVTFRGPSEDQDRELGSEFRRQVFLVFKESVHNAARHSGCRSAEIDLAVDGHDLVLSIADDGAGFDPRVGAEGHGLASMRARAEALGGSARIVSHAGGGGTTVVFRLPLPE